MEDYRAKFSPFTTIQSNIKSIMSRPKGCGQLVVSTPDLWNLYGMYMSFTVIVVDNNVTIAH